jgi:hypothetical protein
LRSYVGDHTLIKVCAAEYQYQIFFLLKKRR